MRGACIFRSESTLTWMSASCCGLGVGVVDRFAAHLPRLLVRGAHRVVIERHVARADVIAVRTDRDVLAAQRRIGAGENGNDVAGGTRFLDELDGAVDDWPSGAGSERIEGAAEERARSGLAR